MKIKTSELIGDALDWAACLATKQNYVNRETEYSTDGRRFQRGTTQPAGPHLSRDWSKGGPIVHQLIDCLRKRSKAEEEALEHPNPNFKFKAEKFADTEGYFCGFGPTPLIASMRCLVAFELGDEVDVPEELT